MAVRTKRLCAGTSGSAGAYTTIYTCPAGETCIVKEVRVEGAAATAGLVYVYAQTGSSTIMLVYQSMAQNANLRLDAWTVLQPGDVLRIHTAVVGGARYWISGTELEGVAD